jgi:hypothetical protein
MDSEHPIPIIATDYSLAICNFPVEGATITQLVLCITTLSASIASFFIFLCILWQRNRNKTGEEGVELFDLRLPKIRIPGISRKKRRHGQPEAGAPTLLKSVDT